MSLVKLKIVLMLLSGWLNINSINSMEMYGRLCTFSFSTQEHNSYIAYDRGNGFGEHRSYIKYFYPKLTCILQKDDDIIEATVPDDFKFDNGSSQILDVILEGSNLPVLKYTLFYNIRRIGILILANCNVVEIVNNAFNKIEELLELNLNGNKLNSISKEVFEALVNMTKLNIKNNNLSFFDGTLKATTFIDLSFNAIKYINITSHYLVTLRLDNNKIENLLQSNFGGIKNLSQLFISNNNISSLSGGVFHNLTRLSYLDLSMNNISTISMSSFLGLENLAKLILDNNKVSDVDIHAFHDLQSLSELSLIGNSLKTLDPKLFSKSTLPSLGIISLDKNPWDCQNLVNIIQISKEREKAVIIRKGVDKSNSSIIGIFCRNANKLRENIENTDNTIIPIRSNDFRSTLDSEKLSAVGNNIIIKLDKIISQLNTSKLTVDTQAVDLNKFLNEGFKNSEFARFFTNNFKNLAFFKYFENQMINFTINSILNQAELMDPNNSTINDIVDILANLTKHFKTVYEDDAINNSQKYNIMTAEKLISQDVSMTPEKRTSENLIIGLLVFLTIIVILMISIALGYFYNKHSLQTKEKLVNYLQRGDYESKVTINELEECL